MGPGEVGRIGTEMYGYQLDQREVRIHMVGLIGTSKGSEMGVKIGAQVGIRGSILLSLN